MRLPTREEIVKQLIEKCGDEDMYRLSTKISSDSKKADLREGKEQQGPEKY